MVLTDSKVVQAGEAPMAAHVSLNIVDMPNFIDDFEEYRARASSGGSLYGVMKRQVFAAVATSGGNASPGPKRPPQERLMKRQRSKSLIPRGVAVPDERSILQMLYEYSEDSNNRAARLSRQHEPRRYSAACVDARDVHRRPLSPHYRAAGRLEPQPRGSPSITSTGSPSNASCSTLSKLSVSGEHLSRRRTRGDRELHLPLTSTASPDMIRRENIPKEIPKLSKSPSRLENEATNVLSPPNPTICRRRSFSVTPKGVVNEGDDIVQLVTCVPNTTTSGQPPYTEASHPTKNISQETDCGSEVHLLGGPRSRTDSNTSAGSAASGDSCNDMSVYRALMLGGPGVGKTALTQQFLTSECMDAQNTSFDTGIACTVPVLLDGEEAILEFYDLPYTGELDVWRDYDVDCYIIVYSITDRRGYTKAAELLADIRRHKGYEVTLILVANKSDLERARLVAKQEGKTLADNFDCKYTEVSAILNHKVDNLLVGIMKQIRLNSKRKSSEKRKLTSKENSRQSMSIGCSLSRAKDCALNRFLRRARAFSRSCEDLFAL